MLAHLHIYAFNIVFVSPNPLYKYDKEAAANVIRFWVTLSMELAVVFARQSHKEDATAAKEKMKSRVWKVKIGLLFQKYTYATLYIVLQSHLVRVYVQHCLPVLFGDKVT